MKRSFVPDVYRQRKRFCVGVATNSATSSKQTTSDKDDVSDDAREDVPISALPSDTKACLLYFRSQFSYEKFNHRLPPIFLKHQIYSIIRNRTIADRQVNDMRDSGEIRVFQIGANVTDLSIIFTEDFKSHVERTTLHECTNKQFRYTINKFFDSIMKDFHDVSISKENLVDQFGFKDPEITNLVKASLLTVRDVGTWWLSFPNAGMFVKSFVGGRKYILGMIRKTKHKEILQKHLEKKNWPVTARLGMPYHIHDVIGADLVKCIPTSSGVLLRYMES